MSRSIDLAPIADPQQVATVIIQVCGIPEQPRQPPDTQIARWMRIKQLLLVIDNYEHVIDSALLLSTILRAAPQVQILVTSRVVLRLTGEHEFLVFPLIDPPVLPSAAVPTRDTAAIALFVERARAVQPTFQLTPANAPLIHAICVQLDGLPLAIELAAARMRLFTPEQLLNRLQIGALPVLDGGSRDLPACQQTMRATIAWSYQLLNPPERHLLARLSVFVGGWTLEAATTVGQKAGRDVMKSLEQLLEHSLIQVVTVDEWPRFTILETIRAFAAEHLADAGSVESVQCQHALYFLAYAERHGPQIDQSAQFISGRLLHADHENLRGALGWWLNTNPNRALHMAGTLWPYWRIQGKWIEAHHWLTRVLETCTAEAPPLLRASALDSLGMCIHLFDENERAITLFEESTVLYLAHGDELGATFSTLDLCLAYRKQGRFDHAKHVLDECLPIFRAYDATYGIARSLFYSGLLLMDQNQLDEAWNMLQQARAVFQQCNNQYYPDWVGHNMGHIARLRGDLDTAERLHRTALTMLHQAGDRSMQHEVGICLGHLARLRGDPQQAAAMYANELKPLYEVGNRRRVADVLDGVGGVLLQVGNADAAAQMLGAALRLRETIAIPLAPAEQPSYQRLLAELHALLPEPQRSMAWEAGRALSLDIAIADALRLSQQIASQSMTSNTSQT